MVTDMTEDIPSAETPVPILTLSVEGEYITSKTAPVLVERSTTYCESSSSPLFSI